MLMTSRSPWPGGALGLLLVAFTTGCGSDSPTSPLSPMAPVAAVTAVTASVDPSTGSRFTFLGTITVNAATEVTYQWERSNGLVEPVGQVTFTGAGTLSVSSEWAPGTCIGTSQMWVRLNILAPNSIRSANAPFTRVCPGPDR
jgi:hypothetical protein